MPEAVCREAFHNTGTLLSLFSFCSNSVPSMQKKGCRPKITFGTSAFFIVILFAQFSLDQFRDLHHRNDNKSECHRNRILHKTDMLEGECIGKERNVNN